MIKSDKMLDKELVHFADQLCITDLSKSTEFYRDIVGFNFIRNHPTGMFMIVSFYDSILMITSSPSPISKLFKITLIALLTEFIGYTLVLKYFSRSYFKLKAGSGSVQSPGENKPFKSIFASLALDIIIVNLTLFC